MKWKRAQNRPFPTIQQTHAPAGPGRAPERPGLRRAPQKAVLNLYIYTVILRPLHETGLPSHSFGSITAPRVCNVSCLR